ncbi:ACP S-malonyltransferase [Limnobacter litoralis]|uniref:Malonyl CoA-acyl carrier protein transacylase n=1 Tax=Limnobacter litoralis TaxID=481366 RepID=A0ABQ5YMT2_9BURK|nr:ACP S-malonyltransferase [Limnobacter litoralis]GLR25899.1 malonyl CoA-acyl carrier protein transacylase [Limnobacter litoralis]
MTSKIAFLFPGQGSQSVGMLNSFESDSATANLYQHLADVASKALGDDIVGLIKNGPAEQLNLTTNTQPAMLLGDVLVFEAWKQLGGHAPAMVAGHSLGEYAALVAAGVLSIEQALPLVRIRAQAMQDAVPVGQGGMAAVLGLSDEAVIQVCASASEGASVVEAVNFNAPSQVVIAGSASAVKKACELAKQAGAKRALELPVSAPFHSSLMKPASIRLSKALSGLNLGAPNCPVINNVDVSIETDPLQIVDALVRQAYRPVRWVETIQKMTAEGATLFVECGPGKVLSGLVKRISDVPVVSMSDPDSVRAALQAVSA